MKKVRHCGLDPQSLCLEEMLKQVQHDDSLNDKSTTRHPSPVTRN